MTAWMPNSNSSTRNFQGYRYNGMVRTNSSNAWPRFADPRNANGPQAVNAFQFGENQNNTTGYSLHPEGHIYEEVGPPSHPPPYYTGEMETRIPSVHQTMDHHFRGSPASLCSRCSIRCSGHQVAAPTLPMCNCVSAASAGSASHTMSYQQPFCNIHSSISQSQLQRSDSPRTLNNSCNILQQCGGQVAHNSAMGEHHHAVPCTLHHQNTMGISNQRYTGTMTPQPPHNQIETETKNKDSNRSLSPFAFLRKNNRDSKASTNGILDNSSNKSALLSCSRKAIVAIVLTLVLIVVLSIAVGLVIAFTVDSEKKVTTGAQKEVTTGYVRTVERVTSKIKGSVRVIRGPKSVFSKALNQTSSTEFNEYADSFVSQTNNLLTSMAELRHVVSSTEVLLLRNGSVEVDFIVNLEKDYSEKKAKMYAEKIKHQLRLESNRSSITAFNRNFPISAMGIEVEPYFEGSEPKDVATAVIDFTSTTPEIVTSPTVTTLRPTTAPREFTIPPASGVCQPITESVCQQVHYNSSGTTFPNFVGHRNQTSAHVLVTILNSLMASTSCYAHLNTFSCALLIPKCGADDARIPPCRRLCEAAFENCGPFMNAVLKTQSAKVNCSWFPDSSDPEVCVSERGPIVPTVSPICPEGYFACDNHTCHENKDRCDSVSDCRDLMDERDCDNFQCVPGQFQCGNGNCRPRVWKCDGRDDCGDASDEEDCEPVAPCLRGEFKCVNGYNSWNLNASAENDVCIDGKFTCDKTFDCTDNSDEDSNYCKNRGTAPPTR